MLNPGASHGVEVPAKLLVVDPAAVEADGDDAALMDVATEVNTLQSSTSRLDTEMDQTEANTLANTNAIAALAALVKSQSEDITALKEKVAALELESSTEDTVDDETGIVTARDTYCVVRKHIRLPLC